MSKIRFPVFSGLSIHVVHGLVHGHNLESQVHVHGNRGSCSRGSCKPRFMFMVIWTKISTCQVHIHVVHTNLEHVIGSCKFGSWFMNQKFIWTKVHMNQSSYEPNWFHINIYEPAWTKRNVTIKICFYVLNLIVNHMHWHRVVLNQFKSPSKSIINLIQTCGWLSLFPTMVVTRDLIYSEMHQGEASGLLVRLISFAMSRNHVTKSVVM